MRGPAYTWPFRDPLDFASKPLPAPNVAPVITMTDQAIGLGDGTTKDFQLVKTYKRGAQVYNRLIHLPIVSSVLVSIDGSATGITWTVSRPGGVISFATAPANGAEIRAGFLFDVEVRFDSDDAFDGIVRTYQVAGFSDVTLVEVRPC